MAFSLNGDEIIGHSQAEKKKIAVVLNITFCEKN